jgi:photosystem II stability/assembly factor-like uncharacterized protein
MSGTMHLFRPRFKKILLGAVFSVVNFSFSMYGVAQIGDAALLAPGEGWTLAENHLYLTTDNGRTWKDITPGQGGGRLVSVFFLEDGTGWALIASTDIKELDPHPHARVMGTHDFGSHWDLYQKDVSQIAGLKSEAMPSALWFTDQTHGWLTVRSAGSSTSSQGQLLKTDDGGKTWSMLPPLPSFGVIRFDDPLRGWLLPTPDSSDLWRTADGGSHWSEPEIPRPGDCENCRITYTLPHFRANGAGSLAITFVGDNTSRMTIFASDNSGTTWSESRSIEGNTDELSGNSVAYIDSQAARLDVRDTGQIETSTGARLSLASLPDLLWSGGRIARAEFTDERNGWAIYTAGRCLHSKSDCSQQSELISTTDGGANFSRITPQQAIDSMTSPMTRTRNGGASPEALMGNRPNPELGFDIICVPTATQLLTWISESPYWDIGVYIGGPDQSCKDAKNLSTIQQISAQGWGIIPIWVGAQSTCVSSPTKPNGSDKYDWISSDASTAAKQGVAEATNAIKYARNLGFSNVPVIYYDIEYYDSSSNFSRCVTSRSDVVSFLQGWKQALQSAKPAYLAGIYGHVHNRTDLVAINPDAIWLAEWNAVKSVTGQEFSAWPSDMRIHQYCSDLTSVPCASSSTVASSWGGVSLKVDGDAVSGPVIPWSAANDLAAPTLNEPAANATNVSSTPLFQWSSVKDATGYRIMASANASDLPTLPGQGARYPTSDGKEYDCASCVINATTSSTSYQAPSSLTSGTVYYWQVHALGNAAGPKYYGLWQSKPNSFTVGKSSSKAPVVVTGQVSSPSATSASLTGSVNPNGSDTKYWFAYGTNSTLQGASKSSPQDAGSGSSATNVVVTVNGLTANTKYYFQLQASNAGGPASGSINSFTTSALPALPAPGFSPVGGTYSTTQNVKIQDSISAAKIYYTTNGTTPTTSSSLYSSPITVNSTEIIHAIAVLTGYSNSPVASATYTINKLPGAPTVLSPGNASSPGQTLSSLTPTFSWTSATGATNYGLYIKDTVSNALVYNNDSVGNVTSLQLPSGYLATGHNYIWNCRASNTAGNTYSSNKLYFQEQNPAPAAPVPVAPGSSASPGPSISNLMPTFQWQASTGATNYGLYVRDVTTGNLVYNNDSVGNITSLTMSSGILTSGDSYRWNMRASNSAGYSAYTSDLYFQEQSVTVSAPQAPSLIAPSGSISNLTPAFQWQASTGATNYGLYVRDVTTGNLVYNNDSIGNITSFTMSSGILTAGDSYRWNMRASNSAGYSAYSSDLYFEEQSVTVSAPQAPSLIAPGSSTAPGPEISNLTPAFQWNASDGATNYGLYIRDLTTNVIVYNNDYLGNVTSIVLPSGYLTEGHSYRWNMRASNSAGFSDYSQRLYFQE